MRVLATSISDLAKKLKEYESLEKAIRSLRVARGDMECGNLFLPTLGLDETLKAQLQDIIVRQIDILEVRRGELDD
jgi:hypothetical protein